MSEGLRPAPAPGSPAGLADEEVVARVIDGDGALFEILMRRHNQRLFRIARGILGDDGEAEDALQEAWLRAYDALAEFRGEAPVVTWLGRIAAHTALARSRRRRRLVPVPAPDAPGESPDPRPPPERTAASRELRRVLRRALDALPDALRAVFVLREVEGLSTRETAEALTLSQENVRVRLHRAKAELRRAIDREVGHEVRRLYLFDGERCDRTVEGVLGRLPPS